MSLMKVAISLPDKLFSDAEKLATRLRVSRSRLYAQALAEYLDRRDDTNVTERLDAIHGITAEPVDRTLMAAQLKGLGDEAW